MVTGWLFPLLIVVLIAALGVGWWLGVKRSSGTGVAVAHTKRAREHPRFRRRLQILRVALGSILAVGLLGGVTSSYLAARPSGDISLESKLATRDIMLCLDVSGSVIDFDAQVVKSFSDIVKDFEGERVGLAMWNSGTRLVFPLTSDYELVIDQLDYVARVLSDSYNYDGYSDLVAGTSAGYTYGSSLIGDGLVSCAQSFDQEEDERSRSIVFATDNALAGSPVFTLEEAAQLAADKGIVVHGLYISGGWSDDNEEMREVFESRGGYYYAVEDAAAAQEIVAAVQAQDAVDLGVVGETITVDTPGNWPIAVGLATLLLLGLAWRFKL